MGAYDLYGNAIVAASNLFNRDGVNLTQAYSIYGQPLFSGAELIVNSDDSTGTSSGYSLISSRTGNTYVLRMVVDFTQTSGYNYQSFVYDPDNGLYYKFDASATVRVYNQSMALVDTVTMPQNAGHNNDGAYYRGKIYFPNLSPSEVIAWDIANNTVSSISITGINQPPNGSTRNCDALCVANEQAGVFYLVCRDVYTTDIEHQSDDKLSVYSCNISTGNCTLLAEFPWDCVYVQGSTLYDGILYVACNTQTTESASNYEGITVKAIRTDTWELVDNLTVSGNFEPEGMDTIPINNGYQIMMGMGKYNVMSQTVRFTPPYSLIGG